MTKQKMWKLEALCYKAILDTIPNTITDNELSHLYLSLANRLMSECAAWAKEDMEAKNE